jgi:hypothetical protein
MAKARNPTTIGKHFAVAPKTLQELDVLNATLAIDTALFIDPLLLRVSRHREMRDAHDAYEAHFTSIIRLLQASRREGDPAWKAALALMQFPEIKGTCLGYGAGSIDGRGFTGSLSERALRVGAEIVQIGVTDPDLFPALALFEDKIGPDRISDMVTNIAFAELAAFNVRILRELPLRGETFRRRGVDAEFLVNSLEPKRTPVILVPMDALRELPIAKDWDEIADAAQHNEDLRRDVNKHIGEIWAQKTKRDKEALKSEALASKEAFQTLLKAIRTASGEPYDAVADPEGLVVWAALGQSYADRFPLALAMLVEANLPSTFDVVKRIVAQFRHLVEHCGLNKELYRDNGKPRHESTAQRLFFAAAYAYCKANNIDISPEIDTGSGKIDFKFSVGFDERVLIEVKLSINPKTVPGYQKQLETYKVSQETMKAIYLVIDVGKIGRKQEQLVALRNAASARNDPLSELEFVDGLKKPSASKR